MLRGVHRGCSREPTCPRLGHTGFRPRRPRGSGTTYWRRGLRGIASCFFARPSIYQAFWRFSDVSWHGHSWTWSLIGKRIPWVCECYQSLCPKGSPGAYEQLQNRIFWHWRRNWSKYLQALSLCARCLPSGWTWWLRECYRRWHLLLLMVRSSERHFWWLIADLNPQTPWRGTCSATFVAISPSWGWRYPLAMEWRCFGHVRKLLAWFGPLWVLW